MRIARIAAVWLALAALVVPAGCVDGTGPRPRPGTQVPEPPPQDAPVLLWFELQPRVVTQASADSIELTVAVAGRVDGVSFLSRTGSTTPLRRLNASLYTTKLSAAHLLFGYRNGDLHNLGGAIEAFGGGRSESQTVIVNVKDATVPTINVSSPVPGVQVSDYVVNIRHDELRPGREVAPTVLRSFYGTFPDDYTFAAVIEQVNSENAAFFIPVRNQITGIGLAQSDRGESYGSGARLEGIIQYPTDAAFDPAATDDIHQIAHRWLSYSTHPALAIARPHWPLSSLAYGIMGWHDPTTNTARRFPFDIIRQADGTHLLRAVERPRAFNDLELYLMGLLPGDSVQTHYVFADQDQRSQIRDNGVLRGGVDSVSVADLVARDGARTPAAPAAPRQFRMATIVLSRNRILTRDEMSFFHHLAMRGEQMVPLPFSDGVVRGTTLPFALATGGRGTLITRIRAAATTP